MSALCCFCFFSFSQKTITDLRYELDKATSAMAKADICLEIADAYTNSLKIDSALYFADKIKEYSQQSNYETGIGKYHLAFAWAIFYRSRNDEAEENAARAIEIFGRQKESILAGRAHLTLANSQYVTGKVIQARKNYWTAIAIFKPIEYVRGLYSANWWMARGYFKTSDIDSASFYYINALTMAEKMNDPDKIFVTGCWVGTTFLSLGEPAKAADYFALGLKFRGPRADKVGLRTILSDYAVSLIHIHEFKKADSVINEVESLNATLKDKYGGVVINRLKGELEYERRGCQYSLKYLNEALNITRKLEIENEETRDILLLLGKAEFECHEYDSAITHLTEAAGLSRLQRAVTDEREAKLLTSMAFQEKGNADSALYYFKYYSALKDSISSQQKQKNIIEITTRYETQKKEQEIKMLEKQQETDAYALALKNQQIEKQELEGEKKSQQLQLLSQQSEISKLEAAQKTLALENQQKEIKKKQNELEQVSKQNQLTATIAIKETQKKKFAYAAALAVLIFGGIAFFKYRQSRKLSEQLSVSLASLKEAQEQLIKTEKEKEAENIRVRISRDIHDEVGATLSGVALYSEIVKQKMTEHREKDAQVYLNHISDNSKEMVEKMSDIVWAINPDNDSFERIITKLQSYAFNLCAGKGITLHTNTDEAVSKQYPSMQVKRNLYLLMKEAINNAMKYSAAKNIYLVLMAKSDSIIVEIKDDGNGFDTSADYMGNGLKNMKARADSLDGDFVIDSKVGGGTTIRIQFQFHPGGGQTQKA